MREFIVIDHVSVWKQINRDDEVTFSYMFDDEGDDDDDEGDDDDEETLF